jgi:hypothetical protein
MADDNNQAVMQAMLLGGMYGPNPYSQFPNGIQSTSYAGTPTDARGRPIGPPPGTTLNSHPMASALDPSLSGVAAPNPFANVHIPQGQNTAVAQPRGGLNTADWNALTPQQRGAAMGPLIMYQQGSAMMPSGGPVASHNNPSGNDLAQQTGTALMTAAGNNWGQMMAGPQQAAPPPQGGTPANSYQDALTRLSNPGHVDTPGANVPASQPITNQPSVLDQFLANRNSGGAPSGGGAGGYSNTGFFDTLNRLKGMSQ